MTCPCSLSPVPLPVPPSPLPTLKSILFIEQIPNSEISTR